VHTVLRVEHRLWGLRPAGYHAVNILLQVLNAFLLWRILRRVAVPGAWLIAALFGVHPLQVESVAWVTELKNLLSGAFYFSAVLAYLRFAGLPSASPARGRSAPAAARPPRFYALSLVLFVLALCSKTTAVTLPAVLLFLVWWRKPALARRDVLPLMPMVALAAAFGAFTWWLETFHVGSGKVLALTFWERLLLPGRVAWFYFGKLLWPVPQSFIYPRWHADPGVWWQWLYPLGVVAVVAVLWRQRQRWGKGPLAAVLFYLLTLVPVSGALRFYFQLYSFVGDHFQYLACIGLLAALVAPAARWASSRRPRPLPAALRYGVPAVVLVALTALTWNRTQVFRSEESLWRDTVAKNPAAWIAHNNLGVACRLAGRKEEAASHFAAALRLNPRSPEALANLGDIYKESGDSERAIDAYRQAVAIKPELYGTQYALGVLLMQRGNVDEAAPCFTTALRFRPQMAEACMMLGDICVARQQLEPAAAQYRAALARDPSLAKVHSRLGWVYTNLGSLPEAYTELLDAVRLNPADAHSQALLGFVLEKRGDAAGARAQYQRALQMDPKLDLATAGLSRLAAGRP
jgi:tetratricopeptide (TPR) repeat protein